MSAQEALTYGLIDEIVQPNDVKLRDLMMPPGREDAPHGSEDYRFGKIVSKWILGRVFNHY